MNFLSCFRRSVAQFEQHQPLSQDVPTSFDRFCKPIMTKPRPAPAKPQPPPSPSPGEQQPHADEPQNHSENAAEPMADDGVPRTEPMDTDKSESVPSA